MAREIALHTGLHHPSIITAYAAWSEGHHVCLALEWAPGVSARALHGVFWVLSIVLLL